MPKPPQPARHSSPASRVRIPRVFDQEQKQHRAELSQNFLKNPSLATFLVHRAGIQPGELVLEIGAGSGVLSSAIVKTRCRLIAVEKDPILVKELQLQLSQQAETQVVQADIMRYLLPTEPYRVFANPPFSISSALVKRLVFNQYPPTQIHLFLQREFANRLFAKEFETQLSVLVKTWYRLDIIHKFERYDFAPVPSVEVILMHFKLIRTPVVDMKFRKLYTNFVMYGFQAQRSYLEKNFKLIFSHLQWKKLAADLKFDLKAHPGELSIAQWTGLFTAFQSPLVSETKRLVIAQFVAKDKY